MSTDTCYHDSHDASLWRLSPRCRFHRDPRPIPEKLYAQMTLIRQFEQRVLGLFGEGSLFGTTHCCIGQEANAVGVINHLRAGDIVFSNHRSHGHFLAWSDRPELLLAELMGRATGIVGGRGGSQHICYGDFYSNGVQGGIVATTMGMALAEKMQNSGSIATVFIGDGTLGQGLVYECLNLASLWNLPVLIVVENNGWAQSTPTHRQLAGDMVQRAIAFGISAGEVRTTDAEQLFEHFGPHIQRIRQTSRPHFEVIHTYRLCHHSKNDDHRPVDEVERHKGFDPLPILRRRLADSVACQIEGDSTARVERAVAWAQQQPFSFTPPPTVGSPAASIPIPIRKAA